MGRIPGIHFFHDGGALHVLERLHPALFELGQVGHRHFAVLGGQFGFPAVDEVLRGDGGIHAEQETQLVVQAALLPHAARELQHGIVALVLLCRLNTSSSEHKRRSQTKAHDGFFHSRLLWSVALADS